MKDYFQSVILDATGSEELFKIEVIQNLWSNYGTIARYGLKNSAMKSVVVKHVQLSDQGQHPRGWNTNLSHQRKINSYKIEMAWYDKWSLYCDTNCYVPNCYALEYHKDEMLMVLEDLNETGFPDRRSAVSVDEIKICLSWLANFHATFMGEQPKNLWPQGTYWYLETRPDELKALNDLALKEAASQIDKKLQNSCFHTFVHGDAKLANFCFSQDGKKVAAVDFQYVGGGCGIKDIAYFIGSCLDEDECQQWESLLLDYYFNVLKQALQSKQKSVNVEAVERDWRALYPYAWTDFHRFLKGWSPNHWKIHSYSERLARDVLAGLNKAH